LVSWLVALRDAWVADQAYSCNTIRLEMSILYHAFAMGVENEKLTTMPSFKGLMPKVRPQPRSTELGGDMRGRNAIESDSNYRVTAAERLIFVDSANSAARDAL